MRSESFNLRDCEGKGLLGCLIFLVLFSVAIFLAIKLGPVYYANYNFEADVKTEVSRAGTRFLDDETIAKDLIDMARRHDIKLRREDITIERFAGQIHVAIHYTVSIDFTMLQRDWEFEIKASSFVGTL